MCFTESYSWKLNLSRVAYRHGKCVVLYRFFEMVDLGQTKHRGKMQRTPNNLYEI